MESEDNDNNGQDIDNSPGSLVWVRRRNGSWWPGQILGNDDLPEGFSNLPRSGTPIKLLGRADGSVDWYNLEKSKRVKAFRCGEYDECIEKVKDHALHSNKKPFKGRKYVRKEQAILHALELEEACSLDGNQNFCYGNDSLTVKSSKGFGLQSNMTRHNKESVSVANKSSKHKKKSQKLSQPGSSSERPSKTPNNNMQYMHKRRWRTPNDSEDDTTKGMKRMRDLQDLGLGMISKSESNGHIQFNGFHDFSCSINASLGQSDFDNNNHSGHTPVNSSRDSCSSLKQKRSRLGQTCESLKKKCRRRSLAEVGMGATKVKTPSLGHHEAVNIKVRADNSSSKKKESSSVIDDNPDCSGPSGTSCEEALFDVIENTGNVASDGTNFQSALEESFFQDRLEYNDNAASDGFMDIPVMTGLNNADLHPTFETFPSTTLNSGRGENQNHGLQIGLMPQLNEGLGEACSTSSSTQANCVRQKIDMGTSDWHTKGKRNVRHPSSNKTVDLESIVDRTDQPDTALVHRNAKKDSANSTSDGSLTSDTSSLQIICMPVAEVHDAGADPKPIISSMNVGKQSFAGENSRISPPDDRNTCNSIPRAIRSAPTPSGDAPIPTRVSLPPRQIRLPSRYRDSEENSSHLYDVELTAQTNYQGQRVPLVSLMSKFNGKAIIGHPVTVEELRSGHGHFSHIKTPTKDLATANNKSQAKGERGGFQEKTCGAPMGRSPWSNKKPSSGKKSGFSPRKIRKLSSFAADRKDKEDRRKVVVEKIGGHAVSCIPLRLVFSRLNEALNSSGRPAN